MSDLKQLYNQTKWAIILRGLLSLGVGIAILVRPIESIAVLALVIALWALFDGMVNIVRSFDLRRIAPHWWVVLLGGIVSVGFGIAALYYFPGLSLSFAIVWTAYWLTATGLIAVFMAFQERSAGVSWGMTMVFGVLAIIAGVFAFASPTATLATLLALISGFALVSSVVLFFAAGRMAAFQGDVRSSFGNTARA